VTTNTTRLDFPTQPVTTIGTTVKIQLLDEGFGSPNQYLITSDAPTDTTITVAAAAVQAAREITINPLEGAIPNLTKVTFGTVEVTLRRPAREGETKLFINPSPAAIPAAATANFAASAIANTASANLIQVTPTPVYLDIGEVLDFGGVIAILSQPAPAGSTQLLVLPLAVALTTGAEAITIALVNVVGATNATPSSNPKTSDSTTYLSGSGVSMAIVGSNRTLNLSFNHIEGDMGGAILMAILYNEQFLGREVWAEVVRDNGETYRGRATLTTGNQTAPTQEKVTQEANMQFQGDSFEFTAASKSDPVAILGIL